MKYWFVLSIVLTAFSSFSCADNNRSEGDLMMTTQTNNRANNLLSTDNLTLLKEDELNYRLVLTKEGTHSKIPITLYRFEAANDLNLEGENISFIIKNDDKRLEGFVRLLPQYHAAQTQVSKEIAESVATEFLTKYAPDLLVNSKIEWIDSHDETILVEGKKVKLRGMKVKCRNSDTGLYFWVIVAPDSSVMVFERDVEWDFIRAGRQTEKWLHDSWLKRRLK